MKSGRSHIVSSDGFTIVEVLIVLAVTSALLLSAIGLLGRSQSRTQFNQAINDLNTQLGILSQNVANGYYASTIVNKRCTTSTALNTQPVFTDVANGTAPTDGSCVYLGRVVQFTNTPNYYFHNIVGRRQIGAPATEVTNMQDANPQIIEPINGLNYTLNYPRTTEDRLLQNGLRLGYIAYHQAGVWHPTSGIAFTGSLASISNNGDFSSGAQTVQVAATVVANDRDTFIQNFDTNFGNQYTVLSDLGTDGIQICFDSGSTNQRGLITVGGNSRNATTKLDIQPGDCNAISPLP